MRPTANGHLSALGKLTIELVDLVQEPAEGAGVRLGVVGAATGQQVMTIASQ